MENLSPLSSNRKKILIVDDQLNNIQVLIPVLEIQAGYSVTYAMSGSEALKRLEVITPDIILLDLYMPEMNGLEVCKHIKENPAHRDIPILFLTANQEGKKLLSAFEAGASDYVTKPFKTAELLARVATHIQIRQQKKELQQNKNKLDIIINNIRDGIVVVDRNSIVRFANPVAAKMLHKPLTNLVGNEFEISIAEKKLATVEVGKTHIVEITVVEAEWEDEPANIAIIGLRDVSQRTADQSVLV